MSDSSSISDWEHLAGREPAGLPVRAGDRFPDLVLPSTTTAEPVSLGEFRGSPLMLHFFASW